MITETQKQLIINAFMPFNPTKIGIFGSYARGENSENSDIDILFDFSNRFSLFDLIQLKQNLEKSINNKVDLVDLNAIHPKLKNNIISDLKIIYEKQ